MKTTKEAREAKALQERISKAQEKSKKQIESASEKIKELTAGKTIVKTIVVPKKLVNIVIK